MKKLIAILLISTFSWSFIKPVVSLLMNSISLSVWKITYKYKIQDLPARSNWLTVLNDLAENNSVPESNSQPDILNQINLFVVGIVSSHSVTYFIGNFEKATPPHFAVVYFSVSGKTSTPPPKLS